LKNTIRSHLEAHNAASNLGFTIMPAEVVAQTGIVAPGPQYSSQAALAI